MKWLVSLIMALWAVMSMAAPPQGEFLPGLDEDSMRVRLLQYDLQPIEGIWQYKAEHMTLGIERCSGVQDAEYRIVLLHSDDLELMPGMVIGYLASSVDESKFRLWLYSERNRLTLRGPMEAVATFNREKGTIIFDPPHWRVKVRANFMRFLPSIFRVVSLSPEKVEERLPVGFNKLFPIEGDARRFNRVRYL
ncbi:MAG: hypothetical protein IJ613_00410 [Muribaculaceae bacterium]|nr:hypothetical protein [Muribaculaceae bacterium]